MTTADSPKLSQRARVSKGRHEDGPGQARSLVHVVTMVDDDFTWGGPLTVALAQLRALQDRGHDVLLLGGWRGSGSPPQVVEGVPARLFRTVSAVPPLRFSGLVAPQLPAWLWRHRHRIDVAHLHFSRDLIALSAGAALRSVGIPFVTQTHGMVVADDRRVAKALDRAATVPLLRRAATRFVLTDREQRDLGAVVGPGRAMQVLPNGIDVPRTERTAPGQPDVLFLARLHPRKRVMLFARAAESLLATHPEARFSVVGPDDGDAAELEAFIGRTTDARGRIAYEGPLPHDAAIERMARASVYVLPSIDEPFPMSMLEAMSLGVSVIATASNGLAAQLEQADAALVVPDDDPVALARAINRVLADPSLAQGLSQRGRELAVSSFGMDAVARQLESAYAAALRPPHRG